MKIFGAVPNFRHKIIERVNLLVDSFYIYKRTDLPEQMDLEDEQDYICFIPDEFNS